MHSEFEMYANKFYMITQLSKQAKKYSHEKLSPACDCESSAMYKKWDFTKF